MISKRSSVIIVAAWPIMLPDSHMETAHNCKFLSRIWSVTFKSLSQFKQISQILSLTFSHLQSFGVDFHRFLQFTSLFLHSVNLLSQILYRHIPATSISNM